ncbi:hypothetical protein K435DRAFT_808908 [Dendrothele bispora CBS 962.96]|uniref:NAD(P)-binding protein n=1 Tax=Dendrothele bispora (strain CBS 962.96) TaxID=1314807 RepID=A0A4S8KZV1_DENBC|nr:hypothetical protein K435DRAFT_808908 [Dendrothele bispora CBS 962.96]
MSDYKRVILVTGSNAGIGYSTVKLLASKGQTVYLSARNEAAGKEAQQKLKTEDNLNVKFVQLDITDIKSVQAAKDVRRRKENSTCSYTTLFLYAQIPIFGLGVIRTEKALRKSRVKNPYSSSVHANSSSSNSTFPQPLSHLSYPNIAEPEDHGTSIDPDQIVQDASQLEGSFNDGYNQSVNGEEDNESESEGENDIGGSSNPSELSNQIDAEILQTRRKSGRATEESTLRQWKAWCPGAIADGLIPDDIVDANHLIRYMQYAATRQLFTKKGTPKQGNDRLSASSLKKVNTMLGRVRRRQEDNNPKLKEERPATNSRCEDYYKALMIQAQCLRLEKDDFDVTVGTILEQQLRPQQFNEITNAIFTKLDQVGSIVKSLFAWNWQTATLDRGDNIVHLILSALQPYQMSLPNYQLANGQVSGEATAYFGVLAMYWQTKTAKPGNVPLSNGSPQPKEFCMQALQETLATTRAFLDNGERRAILKSKDLRTSSNHES